MRAALMLSTAALATALGACTAITGFGGYSGSSATDGGASCDGGACGCGAGPACAAGFSCCGGECVDTRTSLVDCGGCGLACTAGPNATPSCVAGVCTVTCDSGYGDCDGMTATGCEADLTTPTSCGACTSVCEGTQVCRSDGCADSCHPGETDCGGSCASLMTSIMHCGACGHPCPDADNASPTCVEGTCGLECDGDFRDCDGASANGCEAVPPIVYVDADADGYGTGPALRLCGSPPGHASRAGDCDDASAAVHPMAAETCNMTDDDCDMRTDEGLASCMCTPTMESCGDGRDEDCNGFADDVALGTGARMSFAPASAPSSIDAVWSPDGSGGVVVYFAGGVYARFFERSGAPSDAAVPLAAAPADSFPVAVGWDGLNYVAAWISSGRAQYSAFDATGLLDVVSSVSGSRVAAATLPLGGLALLVQNGPNIDGTILNNGVGGVSRDWFTLLSLPAGSTWEDIAVAPVSGTEFVGVGTSLSTTGDIWYQTFGNGASADGVPHPLHVGPDVPARPSAAADPATRQLAVGYQAGSASRVGVYALDTGTVTRTIDLPAGADQVYVALVPGAFLITHAAHSRRARPLDGMLYPGEMITGFRTVSEMIATPGGPYLALTFDNHGSEPAFSSQGLRCP